MRVMGTEMEYSVWCPDVYRDKALENQRMASALIASGRYLPDDIEKFRAFLSNGAKLYEDIGNHPEYSGPEVFGALGTTIAEGAGIKVMASVMANFRKDEDFLPSQDITLLRRITDDKESWGYHLNFQANRSLEVSARALSPLLLQMIGGTSLFGAGHLRGSGGFWTSQRAPYIVQYVNEFTTGMRPLVNTRDEPHADASKWRRLHVIGNDALHSPWASWLRLGTYDLAIALAEARPDIADKLSGKLYESNFVSEITKIAADITDTATTRLGDGQKVTGADCMEIVYREVDQAIQRGDILAEGSAVERQYIMDEWAWAIDALRSHADALNGLVDWKVRKAIHDRIKSNQPDMSLEMRRTIDVGMDDIEKQNGYARVFQTKLETAGLGRLATVFEMDKSTLDAQIDHHQTQPFFGRSTARAAKVVELNSIKDLDRSRAGMDWEYGRGAPKFGSWLDAMAS